MDDLSGRCALFLDELAHPDSAVRHRSVERLVRLGEGAVPALVAALQSPLPPVRIGAIEALGRIGAWEAIEPLLAHWSRHLAQETAERDELILALTRLEIHFSEQYRVLKSLADVLAPYDVRKRLRDVAAPRPTAVPHAAVREPGTIGELVQLLRSTDFATRKAAGDRLATKGPEAFEALCAELEHRHVLATPRALEALGRSGDPRAAKVLAAFHPGLDTDLIQARTHGLAELVKRLAEKPAVKNVVPLALLADALRLSAPGAAIEAARALKSLARTDPCPALRQALKALKGSLLHPVPPEFAGAWHAIDTATAAWKDLPVTAAASPDDATALPHPAASPASPDVLSVPPSFALIRVPRNEGRGQGG